MTDSGLGQLTFPCKVRESEAHIPRKTDLQTGARPMENPWQRRGAGPCSDPRGLLCLGSCGDALVMLGAWHHDTRGDDKQDMRLPWSKMREEKGRSLRPGQAPSG